MASFGVGDTYFSKIKPSKNIPIVSSSRNQYYERNSIPTSYKYSMNMGNPNLNFNRHNKSSSSISSSISSSSSPNNPNTFRTSRIYDDNFKLISSWEPPDSWEVKTSEPISIKNVFPKSPGTESISELNNYSNVSQEFNVIQSESLSSTELLRKPEKNYYDNQYSGIDNDEDQYCFIRIYKTDLSFTTVVCKLNSNADYICKKVAGKFFINDYSKYRLVVIRNNLERTIKPNEYPLLMQKRWLENLGYTSQSKLFDQGREDNSYYFRFVFKEILPSYCKDPKIKDNSHINLAGFGLEILPIFVYQNAKEIISLDLSRNPNIQELHSDLVPLLSSLKFLSLSGNEIHNFPKNIYNLTSLTHVNLSFNRIRNLKHAGIEYLSNLLVLDLQNNLIEDIPESISKGCKFLRYIDLSNNKIKSIPVSLFHNLCYTLCYLNLSFNRLVGQLSSDIGELKVLKVLRLNGNHMDGDIPKRLSECIDLHELDLRGNRFGSLLSYDQDGAEILTETENNAQTMEVLSECKKLEVLLLDGNPIRWIGKISATENIHHEINADIDPSNTVDFPVLKKFSISNHLNVRNQKPMILHLSNTKGTLTELNISFCGLEILPKNFFTKLTGIERLILDGNRLHKLPNFSPSVHQNENQNGPFKLRHLSLYNNQLKTLPDDIGKLIKLEYLDVRSNHLKTLPDSIWQCDSLRSINATSNRLEQFPLPFNDENDTASINIGMSEVNANISIDEFPPLSFSLLALFLADNHLTEDLCLALFYLPNLVVLNASYNKINDIMSWVDCAPITQSINQPSFIVNSPRVYWYSHLKELYLSGNNITTLPVEISNLHNLSWLFLNNNKLSTIPGEVGKLNKLCAFDVGTQVGSHGERSRLRYNINNWPYDWNWIMNIELKYLNFSGNKKFEIAPDTQKLIHFDKENKRLTAPPISFNTSSKHHKKRSKSFGNENNQNQSFSKEKCINFDLLCKLCMLGLMDVNHLLVQIPDEKEQRRIRTTLSEIPQIGIPGGIVKYSISDSLCRLAFETVNNSHDQSNNVGNSLSITNIATDIIIKEKSYLGVWDVVIPKFRHKDNESLFGIFDGRGTRKGAELAEYLFRVFTSEFEDQLKKAEELLNKERVQSNFFTRHLKLDSTNIKRSIKRTFLNLNKEISKKFKTSEPNINNDGYGKTSNENNDDKFYGCSAVIVYMVGSRSKGNCTLYIANVGDSTCILSKAGGQAQIISRSFKLDDIYSSSNSNSTKKTSNIDNELQRIKNAEGWVGNNDLVNGKIDVTRAFGYFSCLGSVNANPSIVKMKLNLGDNNQNDDVVRHSPESNNHDDKAADINFKISQSHQDEFLVLVNGAVFDAIRRGADANNNDTLGIGSRPLNDTAQVIVDIARSALVHNNHKHTYSYQSKSKNLNSSTTTGWTTAATKIRDIALSHSAYIPITSPNQKVLSSKGMMVMVLGLRDIIKTAQKCMNAKQSTDYNEIIDFLKDYND